MRSSTTDHFRGATKMVSPITFNCAGCGVEVSMDWTSPCFGLCERCEETVMAADTAWRPKSGDEHEPE